LVYRVVFTALSDELLYPYIKLSLCEGRQASYVGYCAWAKEWEKENLLYKLASEFCFTTLHSLHLFRSAVRNCNDELAFFSRHKLTSLLYITNNIRYQEILCYDTAFLVSLPEAARKYILNESSRSKNGEAGEGYDFLLENRNKLYKSFLPSDSAPTFEYDISIILKYFYV